MKEIINKKAKFNFNILETFEAGLVLTGDEIKSVRRGKVILDDAFVVIREGEAYLINAYISPYEKSSSLKEARADRKLLLHRKEIDYLLGRLAGANLTIIPLKLNFKRNFAKLEIALASSKKKYDKREAIKRKEQKREAEKILRKAKLEYQKNNKHGDE